MVAKPTRWSCGPYSVAAADAIGRALGLSQAASQVLVRRGYSTVEAARRFLDAAERHDPRLMRNMEDACGLILRHVRAGSRIVVHGDYDADGVCSTAIVVEGLRAVGADPSWHLPSRDEGYGLSPATVERLVAEGTGLLITADCGITSLAEVEMARAGGLDVLVTDHHRPGERLPPCPVLHPALAPYPFDGLCAAGVAHKLAAALRTAAGGEDVDGEHDLDLVTLATVCDLVPLREENRALVRDGLRALARTSRPGLRALMRVAALPAAEVDERAVAFRLGPRLNAAGRLGRADAALELLLTEDEARAAEVADELDLLNRERRDLETRALFAAEAARSEQEDAPVHVIAGEGWHPGVVGIVASRLTERYHRPSVVIALEGDRGRGSGRSIPAFDLHAALAACSGHLRRFGGHRAAAGLEISPERIEAFRRDLCAHAAAVLSPHDLVPTEEVDAIVGATSLGLPLADELRRLGPFGHGNPEPTLLVPATRIANVRPMGQEGQHARFTLLGSGSRAEAVAFRMSPASLARDAAEHHDAAVRLELNDWNGRVEPRAVLAALCETEPGRCRVAGAPQPFSVSLERELTAPLEPSGGAQVGPAQAGGDRRSRLDARQIRDRRGEGIAGVTGELAGSGEPVLVVCADLARRWTVLERLLAGLVRPSDPGPGLADDAPANAFSDTASSGTAGELAVTSWHDLVADPGLATFYRHLLALDPPESPSWLSRSAAGAATPGPDPAAGPGFCHLAWGPSEVEFALAVARAGLDLRGALADVYLRLRERGPVSGSALEAVLEGEGSHPRPPEVCGRLLRVLLELGLVEYGRGVDGEMSCRAIEGLRTELERSPAHRAYRARLSEAERYLTREAAHLGGAEAAGAGRAQRGAAETERAGVAVAAGPVAGV